MSQLTVFFDIGDTLVDRTRWRPGARECLDSLRAESRRVGLLSNTGRLSRRELSALLPLDFDFGLFAGPLVLLSSETKLAKPNPAAFINAVEVAERRPEECVFVGENPEEIRVAKSVGMRAIHIARVPEDFRQVYELLLED